MYQVSQTRPYRPSPGTVPNCNEDYNVFVWEVPCSVPALSYYSPIFVTMKTWTPIIQLWSLVLPWTNTSRRLQFSPEMFNAMLKELQIRMTWCDKDSPIIYTINGYENWLWNETGPVWITSINVPGVAFLIHSTRSQADNKNLMYSRRIKSPDLILLSLYPLNIRHIKKNCVPVCIQKLDTASP